MKVLLSALRPLADDEMYRHSVLPLLHELEHQVVATEIVAGRYEVERGNWRECVAASGFEVVSHEEAVSKDRISSGSRVYSNVQTTGPYRTMQALKNVVKGEWDRDEDDKRRGLEVSHMAQLMKAPYGCGVCTDHDFPEEAIKPRHFFGTTLCPVGDRNGRGVDLGLSDPSRKCINMERGKYGINVGVVQIPPPVNGKINFGQDVGINMSLIKGILRSGGTIIFEVNEALPYLPGREMELSELHADDVNVCFVEGAGHLDMMPDSSTAIREGVVPSAPSEADLVDYGDKRRRKASAEVQIAINIANMLQDGDVIQMGIGAVPTWVMLYLREQEADVDVWSEVIDDGVAAYFDDRTEQGRANIERFIREGRKITAGFVIGKDMLFDLMKKYPQLFYIPPTIEVNDPKIIGLNEHFHAINAATKISMAGQIAAFTIDGKMRSGIGGNHDMAEGTGESWLQHSEDSEEESRAASVIGTLSVRVVYMDSSAFTDIDDAYEVPEDGSSDNLYWRDLSAWSDTVATDGKVPVLVSKILPGLGKDAAAQRMFDCAMIVTEWGDTGDLSSMSVGERITAISGVAHPVFREKLREIARADGWEVNGDAS